MELKNRTYPNYHNDINFHLAPLSLEDATVDDIKREKNSRVVKLKNDIERMKERLRAAEEELKQWESI